MPPYNWKYLAYSAAGIVLGLSSLPHLLPSLLQQELEAKHISVPDGLEAHVHKIAFAMGVKNPHKINVFINNGLRIGSTNYRKGCDVSGGSTLLPYGAVVGISRAALFKSESDVFNAGLQWNGKPIDGNIVRGEYQLSELIIPSTQQINFAIAHELVHVKHLDFIPQSLLPPSLIIVFYQLGRALKSYFPMRNTIVLVPAVLMFSVLMMNVPSVLCHWQEYRADREAALCGVTYTEGGIITMKKRMLLDHWLGNKPKSFLFDNEAYPPLEKRLDQLIDIYNKQR